MRDDYLAAVRLVCVLQGVVEYAHRSDHLADLRHFRQILSVTRVTDHDWGTRNVIAALNATYLAVFKKNLVDWSVQLTLRAIGGGQLAEGGGQVTTAIQRIEEGLPVLLVRVIVQLHSSNRVHCWLLLIIIIFVECDCMSQDIYSISFQGEILLENVLHVHIIHVNIVPRGLIVLIKVLTEYIETSYFLDFVKTEPRGAEHLEVIVWHLVKQVVRLPEHTRS